MRVAERAQTVVVLLTGGVPESQADGLVVDHDTRRVVVEDGRDVLAREGVGGVGDEQTCLADSTVTGDNALQRLSSWRGHVCCGVRVGGLEVSLGREEGYYAVRSQGGDDEVGGDVQSDPVPAGMGWYKYSRLFSPLSVFVSLTLVSLDNQLFLQQSLRQPDRGTCSESVGAMQCRAEQQHRCEGEVSLVLSSSLVGAT